MEEEMAATGGIPQQDTGPLEGPAAPGSGLRWRRVFPGEERQLGVLRRWLASLLPDCPARDDVTSGATELGSNALVHTASGQGGWFTVEITWHKSAVRVAVADCGAPAGPRVIDNPEGEHGRGLLVVRELSARTGACGDERGRLVWADVPWDAGDAEPASPQDRYEAAIRDGQGGLASRFAGGRRAGEGGGRGDGRAGLASRFAGVPAWFGRSTLQWWALAGGELVAASSAQELASLLGGVLNHPPPWRPAARDTACEDAKTARAAGRDQRPGILAPQFPPGRALLPRDGLDGTRRGGHGGPRTLSGGCRPGVSARRTVTSGGLGFPGARRSGGRRA